MATQFGRWADMQEWFKEACGIKEKTRPSNEVKTIPVSGEWRLRVYIPARAEDEDGGYASAMETAMSLLAAMGTRPEDAYLERGYCVIWLKPAEFYEAKELAADVRSWLVIREYKTTVGDYPEAWEAGVPALLNFEQDNRDDEERSRSKELRMLQRLCAELTRSTEDVTLVLTRGQVEALMDLVGQFETEWNTFEAFIGSSVQGHFHIEDGDCDLGFAAWQILEPLAKLSRALRTVLQPGTRKSKMTTPNDKSVWTFRGWHMPNGRAPANKKCIVEGCDKWAAYHLCDQHALPGIVVEAGTGETFVISTWLVALAGRMLLIILNDCALGELFGGREAFEDQLRKQGYTVEGLISSEAELRRHPQLRMTLWEPTLSGSKDELPLKH